MKRILAVLLAAAAVSAAQDQSAVMSPRESNELFTRSIQLMESAMVALPELNRAGAPLIENARQALVNLRQRPNNSEFTYTFLTNTRAYMMLADSVPRPFPFSQEAARQLAELRDGIARTEAHFRALLRLREAQLRTADRDNLARYAEANQKLPQPGAKPRVVFLGDSITEGWRLNEFFPDHDYVNRGISGQITGEMLGRFKADVVDLNPKVVVILAGVNDLARGVNILAIENNHMMMADIAEKHGIKAVFASVLPVSDHHKDQNPAWERTTTHPPILIRALNDWLKSFTSQRGLVYLDYYSAMIDGSGQLSADLADDGLHPNGKGYRVMAPLLTAAIEKAVGTPPQQKPARRRLFSKD